MTAGQITQPVRAAGGAAAMPLTTVVYAATSLTFQRAALPRQVMAAVRNPGHRRARRTGPVNAAALRFHSRDPHRPASPLATLDV